MKEILDRLEIFKGASLLTEEDVEVLKNWLTLLLERGYTDEKKLTMMFTHAVMMIHRSRENQVVTKLDDTVISQIYNHDNYNEAEELFSILSNIYQLHAHEKEYMLLHLCNLIGK